ncbi:MAG: Re/Si-specific NAD(P)(+) transhydrogenase subunit alpha [Candidatus Hydrogenedentes bacterium]|jgi:NAD(P) transhydrogenase subunit alpha|nr:Re/Si-specific NAD(P)(+) transhydrogenase subunit alpha [Candidatus Hydrogenedentota bacterium]
MRFFVPKETALHEKRAAVIPDTVSRLVQLGAEVVVESQVGEASGFPDDSYVNAGASVSTDREALLSQADVVLRVGKPSIEDINLMKKGSLHIGLLEPFTAHDVLDALMAREVDAIAMEMIPRTTLAQKMDVLSSQANLAGYVAVIIATNQLNQVLPMMMTPAGTLKPARVFIIGVGVAGLQAIATARRLGARVEAFDTRPAVEEQVRSLGARFVKIDLGETGQTKDGYAIELTDAQKEQQKEAMAKVIAQSDIVITTAQVFGRKAPLIVTREMIAAMKPGSVVVDLAAETGGNVEGVEPGVEQHIDGVTLIGADNFASRVPRHASQVYGTNLLNLISHFWDEENKTLKLDAEDEIMDAALIIQSGALRNEQIKQARQD